MSDTISRQAAIDAIDGEFNITGRKNAETILDYVNGVNKKLRELPSAERHGRWIKKCRGNYLCSVCGAWFRTTDEYGNTIDGEMTANYCESCGAKMDEVEE